MFLIILIHFYGRHFRLIIHICICYVMQVFGRTHMIIAWSMLKSQTSLDRDRTIINMRRFEKSSRTAHKLEPQLTHKPCTDTALYNSVVAKTLCNRTRRIYYDFIIIMLPEDSSYDTIFKFHSVLNYIISTNSIKKEKICLQKYR